MIQPGVKVGQRTFCPVSGAAFVVTDASPHRDVGGAPIYLCCDACAEYFDAHRATVIAVRGLAAAR